MFCVEGVPDDTLDIDCCHHHASGMGSSLFFLTRDCSLGRGAACRHSFPLLHRWRDRESPRLAGWTSLDIRASPLLGVQTEKLSMQKVSPEARALMWSAGVTSSAMIPTVGAFLASCFSIPRSSSFFLFALFWALGTLASNWTSRTGDFSKARRALGRS